MARTVALLVAPPLARRMFRTLPDSRVITLKLWVVVGPTPPPGLVVSINVLLVPAAILVLLKVWN